jgi:hypothetical protein
VHKVDASYILVTVSGYESSELDASMQSVTRVAWRWGAYRIFVGTTSVMLAWKHIFVAPLWCSVGGKFACWIAYCETESDQLDVTANCLQ